MVCNVVDILPYFVGTIALMGLLCFLVTLLVVFGRSETKTEVGKEPDA